LNVDLKPIPLNLNLWVLIILKFKKHYFIVFIPFLFLGCLREYLFKPVGLNKYNFDNVEIKIEGLSATRFSQHEGLVHLHIHISNPNKNKIVFNNIYKAVCDYFSTEKITFWSVRDIETNKILIDSIPQEKDSLVIETKEVWFGFSSGFKMNSAVDKNFEQYIKQAKIQVTLPKVTIDGRKYEFDPTDFIYTENL
jgi:hypothetical protein